LRPTIERSASKPTTRASRENGEDHRRQRPAILDYAVILGAWFLMFAYMTSGGPYYPIVTRNPVR
jgi:hypothetical protein